MAIDSGVCAGAGMDVAIQEGIEERAGISDSWGCSFLMKRETLRDEGKKERRKKKRRNLVTK